VITHTAADWFGYIGQVTWMDESDAAIYECAGAAHIRQVNVQLEIYQYLSNPTIKKKDDYIFELRRPKRSRKI
jgi:hypothetical protein